MRTGIKANLIVRAIEDIPRTASLSAAPPNLKHSVRVSKSSKDGLNNPEAQSINYFDKLDPKAPLAIFNFRIRPSGLYANFTVI